VILDLDSRWSRLISFTTLPRFLGRRSAPGRHEIGGWLDTTAGLGGKEKGEVIFSLPETYPRPSSSISVAAGIYLYLLVSAIRLMSGGSVYKDQVKKNVMGGACSTNGGE
jgi:hypothetical protein